MNNKHLKFWLVLLTGYWFTLPAFAYTKVTPSSDRIVSIGSAVTDLVVTLGGTSQLVAVDSTSNVPPSAHVKMLGYQRQLSAEGILSVKPSVVVGSDEMGPPEVLQLLQQAKIPLITLSSAPTLSALQDNIRKIATLLGTPKRADLLIKEIDNKVSTLTQRQKTQKHIDSTIFLLILGSGSPQVAGKGTVANRMIELAGGENTAAQTVNGYKPISQESLLEMKPQTLLVPQRILNNLGGTSGLIKHYPILAATPAGENGQIYGVDQHALIGGFSLITLNEAQRLASIISPPNSSKKVM
ncbi:heme/hemin ABC transporter substrate-binding protein [Vibrio hepatarius]|uniref:heme/hemin ABC transporter substrate-binding protein n=1 Tax=Vibrio hepatarius TaxID=171383 RepID=UPI001C08775E|nr:ABC transporter substrate-binding protein [Vibrio hepatarius]MBU2895729.1 ABC transporter substrate-binding protein [Vibrio hepatarius]